MNDYISGEILDFILRNVETVGITVINESGVNRALSENARRDYHKVTIKGKSFIADFNIDFFGHDVEFLNNKRKVKLVFHVTDETKKGSEAFAELITILSDQYTSDQLNIVRKNRDCYNFVRHLELPNTNGIDLLDSLNYDERRTVDYYVHNYPLKREFRILDEIMKVSFIEFDNIEIDSELLSLIKQHFSDIMGTEEVLLCGLKFTNCRIAKNCDWTILKGCNIEIQNSNINLDDFAYSCNRFWFRKCNISHSKFIKLQAKELVFSNCKIDLPRLFLTASANNLEDFCFDADHDIEDELDNLKYFAPNLKRLILNRVEHFDHDGKIQSINFFSGFKYLTDINLIEFGYEHPYCMLVEFSNPERTAERYTKCKGSPFYGYEYVPFDGYEDMCEKQRRFKKKDAKPKKLYADQLFDLEMARAARINSLYRRMYNARDHITEKEMHELLYNYEGYVRSDNFLKNDGFYDWDIDGLVLSEYKKDLLRPEDEIQLNWPYFNIPHKVLQGSSYKIKLRQAIGFAINSATGIPIRLRLKRQSPQFYDRPERSEEERKLLLQDYNAACELFELAYKYKKWTEMRKDCAPFVVPYSSLSSSITTEFIEQNFPSLTSLIDQLKMCRIKLDQEIHQISDLYRKRDNLESEIIKEIESHLNVLTSLEVVFLMTRFERSEKKSRILKYQKYNSILSKAIAKLDFSNISDESIARKIGQDIIDKIDTLRTLNYCIRELRRVRSKNLEIVIDDETANVLFSLTDHVAEKKEKEANVAKKTKKPITIDIEK